MKFMRFSKMVLLSLFLAILFTYCSRSIAQNRPELKFEITFPRTTHAEAITGRVYVMITKNSDTEPRFTFGRTGDPLFGEDIENLSPGQKVLIDENTLGSPVDSLAGLPAGEYYVQGFVNIYTEFHRADGHVVWLHNDQWEGQHFNRSPGNLYSDVAKVNLDPKKGYVIQLDCKNKIPPIEIPADTKWVKRIKFKSQLLSEFWGQPIYLGATVLLPKDYEKNPNMFYPVDYIQGHFSLRAPKGFRTDDPGEKDRKGRRGYEFYKTWIQEDTPRMILVTFQHPCPYFDDSYAVNSANCGPYGDAIMQELIPEIESRFRIIKKPYARILEGGSTGGWEAMALQVFHPDFFGGSLVYCPDPVDFRVVQGINIYKDKNMNYRDMGWYDIPIPYSRRFDGSIILTNEQVNKYELVLGTRGRSTEQWDIWQAVFGPVGDDGYTKLLYDKITGKVDPEVAEYWKENYDLKYYLEHNWASIAEKLEGKLYFFAGDMDTYYLNNAVHLLQDFMEQTRNPHYSGYFLYGPRQVHCWTGPFSAKERLEFMANHIIKRAPEDAKIDWWNQ